MKPTAIQRWSRLDRRSRALLIESGAALSVASLAVRLLPFRWAVRLGARELAAEPTEDVASIQWAIDAAARRLPWHPLCIQRGIAAQWMLRRRGIDARLHYGLRNDESAELKAHVWVEASGEALVGGENASDYVRVATFP